ncbi:PilT/PilU family type 4a pilus ATPase [Candidatus Gracilibacteria bacterium]|nr:PilT/PilU family type 4a pilus ATPase [Candidatus Gracilibacteria bacterium]
MNAELEDKFKTFVDIVISNTITDMHIGSGSYPYIRESNREITPITQFGIVSYDDIISLVIYMNPLLNQEKIENTKTGISFIYQYKGTRFRANVSKNNDGVAIALRTIKKNTPTAESVGLNENVLKLLNEDRGLILVTGGTGSGKTTSVIAMIDYLNKNKHKHIIMVEDPVEYILKNNQSLIHQKQVGRDVSTFDQAIRDAMREDPDIIVVGEMRDQETISAVLTLAETGHLVISTLHTNDVVQAFDRLIYTFPAQMQSQVRIQIALVLSAIIGQILLPKAGENGGNVVAREIFINTDSSRNIIMDGNISHLYSVMETGKQDGQVMMQQAMIDLHSSGQITGKTLTQHVKDPVRLKDYLMELRKKGEKDESTGFFG